MLSFKLRKKNHRLSKVFLWLFVVGYLSVSVAIIWDSVASYLKARRILADYTVIQAPIELDSTTQSYSRRAGTRTTYYFRYHFEVDGTHYEDFFVVHESDIDKYRGRDSVEVAFSNRSHEFELLDRLESKDSLVGKLWGIPWIMFFALILMLAAGLLFRVRQKFDL